jgi:23S rRNA (uracil1939-C5)-methyltransferase
VEQSLLTIEALSTRGEGIARREGKAVFVPFALPGESLQGRVIEQHKNYDRAIAIEFQHTSSLRTDPECPYFGVCGGCHLQHVQYQEQLCLKQQWLEETFRRIAHLEVRVNPVIPSPPYFYRNKISPLIFIEQKTLHVAYHQIYQPNRLVLIEDCAIAHPLIRAAIVPVRDVLRGVRFRFSRQSRNPARVVLRVIDDRLTLHLPGVQVQEKEKQSVRDRMKVQANIHTVLFDGEEPGTGEDFDEESSGVSQASFLQVNDVIRAKLYDYVLNLPFRNSGSVLDGYCGVGMLTVQLAERFAHVTGVEANRAAVRDAEERIRVQGRASQVQVHGEPMERYLHKVQRGYDVVILNPPRAGLSEAICREVAALQPEELVMISCHPAALARDVSRLVQAGYQIQSLQPFDMFPQTYHYEVVGHLRKSNHVGA